MKNLFLLTILYFVLCTNLLAGNPLNKYEGIIDLLQGTSLFEGYTEQKDLIVVMAGGVQDLYDNKRVSREEYLEFQSMYFELSSMHNKVLEEMAVDLADFKNIKNIIKNPKAFTLQYRQKFNIMDNYINDSMIPYYTEITGYNMGFGLITKLAKLVVDVVEVVANKDGLFKEIKESVLHHFLKEKFAYPSWYILSEIK